MNITLLNSSIRSIVLSVTLIGAVLCCQAQESSYRIAFADNGSTTDSSTKLYVSNVNRNLANFVSEGCDYIRSFDTSSFDYIYRAKKGMGWVIGSFQTNTDIGRFTIILNESGQVEATQINVAISASQTYKHSCAIKVNGGSEMVKSKQLTSEDNIVFTFQLEGEQLQTLYLSNSSENAGAGIPFYLHYIEVVYQDNGSAPSIETDNTAEVHYYTLQGIEVSAADLTPGLYLRREGTRTTLHLLNPTRP